MHGVRRGFLKYYLLKLLSEESYTGYGLIKKIEEETGFWEPSTGSIYPLLETLEEEGLIENKEKDRGKSWSATRRGKEAYDQASKVREEIERSLKKSLIVFSQIFNEEEFKEIARRIDGEHKNPSELRAKIKGLYHRLHSIADHPDCNKSKLMDFIEETHERLEELELAEE